MKQKKYLYYDKNGKWFSSSDTLDIDGHKKRFGNDITFSVIGIDGKFSTKTEYKKAVNNNKTIFDSKSKEEKEKEIIDAKNRIKEKRKLRKHLETFDEFRKK